MLTKVDVNRQSGTATEHQKKGVYLLESCQVKKLICRFNV